MLKLHREKRETEIMEYGSNVSLVTADPARTAEVVVMGGVNSTSTAFQLAECGDRDVVPVDCGQLESGATGKPGALVRAHYASEAETPMTFG